VFKNGVLRKIFGSDRGGSSGDWRKVHNEELHDWYCTADIVRVTKSRRM